MVLPALEQSLERWLRAALPLPAEAGDVSFETPNGTWGSAVSRPTVNLFMHEISRGSRPHAFLPPREGQDGVLEEVMPAPRIAFTFLVSAWAGGVRDEHLLLGDVLRTVLGTPSLPEEHLDEGLTGPVELTMGDSPVNRVKDVWSGIDGKLRASLLLVATLPVPVGEVQPVAPGVTSLDSQVARRAPSPPASARGSVQEQPRPARHAGRAGWTAGG